MKFLALPRRTLALLAVLLPLLGLFIYVALRSGPLAPVPITLAAVESRPLGPTLSGLGTVEARHSYKIGPTAAGRLQNLDVQVGDRVHAGQLLGTMDPVDLEDRIQAQEAAVRAAQARLEQARAQHAFARTQATRYEKLLAAQSASQETVLSKRQDLALAEAALASARDGVGQATSELQALRAQIRHLRLLAPVGGLITARNVEPGSTVVAGQAVIEMIDPDSLWINARFDQSSTSGLAQDLAATIRLRSRPGVELSGRVLRIEPLADAVTEEILAKIVFDAVPSPLPPLGELAEVTVLQAPTPAAPTIPNAAIRLLGDQPGVWQYEDQGLRFRPLALGPADLDGHVQVYKGLREGDRVVLYSAAALSSDSRVQVVERIDGVSP